MRHNGSAIGIAKTATGGVTGWLRGGDKQRSIPHIAVVVPVPAERGPEVVGVLAHRQHAVVRVLLHEQLHNLRADAMASL